MNCTHFQIDKAATQQAHQLIPYSAAINLNSGTDQFNTRLYSLPFIRTNIGNVFLPALHGGLIGGFLQCCINLHLIEQAKLSSPVQQIDFAIDYLRSGKAQDSYAQCQIMHPGRRIAHITATMWQENPEKPIAFARAHLHMPAID